MTVALSLLPPERPPEPEDVFVVSAAGRLDSRSPAAARRLHRPPGGGWDARGCLAVGPSSERVGGEPHLPGAWASLLPCRAGAELQRGGLEPPGWSGFLWALFVYIRETCLSLKCNMCSLTGRPLGLVLGEAREPFGSEGRLASAVLQSCPLGYFLSNSEILGLSQRGQDMEQACLLY